MKLQNKFEDESPIRSLILSFHLPLYPRQIPQWRGAFIQMAGWEDDLFHNHRNSQEANEFHYRYPLIQYRVQRGKTTIFAINEGVEALQKVLADKDWILDWQGEKVHLQIEDLRMNEHYFRTLATPKRYKLFKWLALNQENYEKWQQCKGLKERVDLLERILGSNLIALFKGLDWRPAERIEVNIEEVRHSELVRLHEASLLAFNIVYSTNVLLPPGIAIGKGVSHGFGWQMPDRKRHQIDPKRKREKLAPKGDKQ